MIETLKFKCYEGRSFPRFSKKPETKWQRKSKKPPQRRRHAHQAQAQAQAS
jgi:hypothetical protein